MVSTNSAIINHNICAIIIKQEHQQQKNHPINRKLGLGFMKFIIKVMLITPSPKRNGVPFFDLETFRLLRSSRSWSWRRWASKIRTLVGGNQCHVCIGWRHFCFLFFVFEKQLLCCFPILLEIGNLISTYYKVCNDMSIFYPSKKKN